MKTKYIRGYKWYLINFSIWFFLFIFFFYLIPFLVSQNHQIAIDFFLKSGLNNSKISASWIYVNQNIGFLYSIYLIIGFAMLLFGYYTAVGRYEGSETNHPQGVKFILIGLNFFILIFFDSETFSSFLGILYVQILIRVVLFLSLTFIPISNYFFVASREKANRFERFTITISDWFEG